MTKNAIFLSASVPKLSRGEADYRSADFVAITSAVSALLYVTLGRRHLVWGGHPAITPMIWATFEDFKLDYGAWVKLYQSRHFEEEFPEENKRFKNVVFTDNVNDDQKESLVEMRRRMLTENKFSAAVFIGGMQGVVDEFRLFRHHHPSADVVPVLSTGGAVRRIPDIKKFPDELWSDLNYVMLLHRYLGVDPGEVRSSKPGIAGSMLD